MTEVGPSLIWSFFCFATCFMAHNSSIRKKYRPNQPVNNINKKRLARAIMLCSNLREVNRKYKLYGNKILTLCRLYKGRTKPADPSNYRSISLLSVFTKIFEKEKKTGVSWLFWRQIAFFAIHSMSLGKSFHWTRTNWHSKPSPISFWSRNFLLWCTCIHC